MLSKISKRMKPLSFSSILLSATLLSACSFSAKTSRHFLKEAIENGGYDIIVVPGVPFENGQWSRTMKGRVYWSLYLFEKGVARNIMYSGSAVYTPYREAEIMSRYAQSLGIPEENIFTETKAEHSTENIYYSYKKSMSLGFKSIALASDQFQTKMLHKYTKKVVSPEVGILPMLTDTLEKMEPDMLDPKITYTDLLIEDFVPLNERESFRIRFRGTRGLNVDTTAYKY